ncbi:MAG: cation:proton antiporter [Pirellulaceae bacterium]
MAAYFPRKVGRAPFLAKGATIAFLMETAIVSQLILSLLVILGTGLAAGILCKHIGLSLLVGYLLVGAAIGQGGLGLVSRESSYLEYLAHAGALMLLFSIGIEFSLEELVRLSRYLLVGGVIQMAAVAGPLTVTAAAFGMGWRAALLAGTAGALSSTVLVFKALNEWGESSSPHGRRAIGILLFQDIALVPLLLLVPLLTGEGRPPEAIDYLLLGLKSVLFVTSVIALRAGISRWGVPLLARMRSVELVVLFALCVLGGVCYSSYQLGLPPPVGALAAGVTLSGSRLSNQIDTILLPYRESFAAIFFVSLGTLLDPFTFIDEPLTIAAGLAGMLLLKSAAGALALRATGLGWRASCGMGLGLAQLGEFSFLLVLQGVQHQLISIGDYNRMLFIALGSLVLTPLLLRWGLRWTDNEPQSGGRGGPPTSLVGPETLRRAIVIGIGPIGRQLASRLEMLGFDTCLVDLSPINLYPFAQQGFHTIAGDARDKDVLDRAGAKHARLVIVSVPVDDTALQIVRSIRESTTHPFLLVRCRYQATVASALKLGAQAVVSEEAEASQALLRQCEQVVAETDTSRRL